MRHTLIVPAFGFLALMGLFVWLGSSMRSASRASASSELSGMESRLRFIRLEDQPSFCAAALPSVGGFAPQFRGIVPCAQVESRITLDQEMRSFLGEYVYMRVRGTQACLARSTRHGGEFAFACPPDFAVTFE